MFFFTTINRKPSNNGPLRHSYNTITRAREGLALVSSPHTFAPIFYNVGRKVDKKVDKSPIFFRTKKAPYGLKTAWVLDFLMELLTGFEPATY